MYPELLPSLIFLVVVVDRAQCCALCWSDASQRNFLTLSITHMFLHNTYNLFGFKLHQFFGVLIISPRFIYIWYILSG